MSHFNWPLFVQLIYILVVIAVSLKIIWDTRSQSKTLAYVMLVIFFPIVGIFIYFSFGVNYRKNKIYDEKLFKDKDLRNELDEQIKKQSKNILNDSSNDVDEND